MAVTEMRSIAEFGDFFRRYQQLTGDAGIEGNDEADTPCCDDFIGSFNRIRPEFSRLLEAVRQEEKEFAPRFNIYRALHIERKEAVCHTPMLAHLLDPSASHGQGMAFLKPFLNMVQRRSVSKPPDGFLEGGHWTVLREFYIAGVGILDVLIENPGKKCIVVIENKIDANDHLGQLPNYKAWAEESRRDYDWRYLIYLTPDGRCPKSEKARDWLCLSYKKDIRAVLKEALHEVNAIPVQEAVRQYLSILSELSEDSDDQGS